MPYVNTNPTGPNREYDLLEMRAYKAESELVKRLPVLGKLAQKQMLDATYERYESTNPTMLKLIEPRMDAVYDHLTIALPGGGDIIAVPSNG